MRPRGPKPRLPGVPAAPHSSQAQALRASLGAAAERFVDALHEACALAGLAWVFRVSSHMKITGARRGRIEGVLTGLSVVDAMGWTCDGRAVAVEIKHVASETLRGGGEAAWRLPLDRIEPHQRAMLRRCELAGGLALLLVVHGGRAYAVPWREVEAAIEAGAASLLRADLEPHLCDPRRPYLARWVSPRAA